MIYVSSSCVKAKTIREAIEKLIGHGFLNIELSAGTEYYANIEEDLMRLKNKNKLNFLLHNYFPPHRKHFVINLASLDDAVYKKSLQCLKRSLELCKRLGVERFGFHAGFFMDIKTSELGKRISVHRLYDKTAAYERFCRGFAALKKESGGIGLYLENNVLSPHIRKNLFPEKPFMLTDYNDYRDLKRRIVFRPLVDIAHLRVTSKVLRFDFKEQLKKFLPHTDYLHMSDGDGFNDHHRAFKSESRLLEMLSDLNLKNKIIVLEVYGGLGELKESYKTVRRYLG